MENLLDIDRELEALEWANAQPNQRTNEWFNQRLGRFTASNISDLLGVKGLGLTGESLCLKKASELIFGRDEDEDFESYDMKRGNELEPFAFRCFSELKSLDFINTEQAYFFPYQENGGASPDGMVGNDAILEIKCPRPDKFFKICAKGIDAVDKNYIDQMQMQMLCTNSVRCHFFNFIIFNGVEMHDEIIVERDENRINFIKERIVEASILRDSFVEILREKLK